jgi:hypothetical protein
MSHENVELVERVLGEAQDRPSALWEVLDDEVVWEIGTLDIPDAGTTEWRGPGGVREFFRSWTGPFDEWGYEVVEVIDAGDSVVAHIPRDAPFREGRGARGRGRGAVAMSDRFVALEAAGLRG